MFTRTNKLIRAQCEHGELMTVRSAGIERTVCESCGRVSFKADEGLARAADRSQFERESERQRQTVS